MVGARDIYCDELSKVIFPESWSDALLQRVVVSDNISNIYEMGSSPQQGMDGQVKYTIQDVVNLPRRRFEQEFRNSLDVL
jgi:hypothetical protein